MKHRAPTPSTALRATHLMLALACSGTVHAQQAKPQRIIVPYAPGGTGDVIARLVAQEIAGHGPSGCSRQPAGRRRRDRRGGGSRGGT
jgi:hypothetical protein